MGGYLLVLKLGIKKKKKKKRNARCARFEFLREGFTYFIHRCPSHLLSRLDQIRTQIVRKRYSRIVKEDFGGLERRIGWRGAILGTN